MNITNNDVKSMDLDIRQMLKAFLLNMGLLTPKERGIVVRLINQLYPPMAPIEKDYYEIQVSTGGAPASNKSTHT